MLNSAETCEWGSRLIDRPLTPASTSDFLDAVIAISHKLEAKQYNNVDLRDDGNTFVVISPSFLQCSADDAANSVWIITRRLAYDKHLYERDPSKLPQFKEGRIEAQVKQTLLEQEGT